MASVFPHHPPVDYAPREQTNVVVNGTEPTDVLQILSSEAAQEILGAVRNEPRTASDIADAVDRSLQSVSYHLDRLCEADLIEPAETCTRRRDRDDSVRSRHGTPRRAVR